MADESGCNEVKVLRGARGHEIVADTLCLEQRAHPAAKMAALLRETRSRSSLAAAAEELADKAFGSDEMNVRRGELVAIYNGEEEHQAGAEFDVDGLIFAWCTVRMRTVMFGCKGLQVHLP